MNKPQLFQYAILWHPTEKQIKDEGLKSTVLVKETTVLAPDVNGATMVAAMSIPQEKRGEVDQIEIAVRPF